MNFPGRNRTGDFFRPFRQPLLHSPRIRPLGLFVFYTSCAVRFGCRPLHAPRPSRFSGHSAGAAQACDLEQFYQFDGVAFYLKCRHEYLFYDRSGAIFTSPIAKFPRSLKLYLLSPFIGMRDVVRAWNSRLADSADGKQRCRMRREHDPSFFAWCTACMSLVVAGLTDRFDRASRDALAAGAVGIE